MVDGAQEDKRTRGLRGQEDKGTPRKPRLDVSWQLTPPPTTTDPPYYPRSPFCSSSVTSFSRSSPPLPDPPRPQLIFHPKTPPLSPNCPLLLVIILFCIALNMTDKVSRKPNRPKFSFCKYNQHTHTKNQHVNKSFALFTWYCLLSVWFDKVFVYYFSKNFVVFIREWQSRTVEQDNSQAVPFKVHLSDQTAPKTSTCPTKRPTKTLRRENNALLKVNDDIA